MGFLSEVFSKVQIRLAPFWSTAIPLPFFNIGVISRPGAARPRAEIDGVTPVPPFWATVKTSLLCRPVEWLFVTKRLYRIGDVPTGYKPFATPASPWERRAPARRAIFRPVARQAPRSIQIPAFPVTMMALSWPGWRVPTVLYGLLGAAARAMKIAPRPLFTVPAFR